MKEQLQALDDCLRLKSEIHLVEGLDWQAQRQSHCAKQLVGISVATRLCRSSLRGTLQRDDLTSADDVHAIADGHLRSEDAPLFAQAMIQQCADKGAHYTLPVYRIVPIARRILDHVIPRVDHGEMHDGEASDRTIMPARMIHGLLRVSRERVKGVLPPSMTLDEYAEILQADLQQGGLENAQKWIVQMYGEEGYVVMPDVLVTAAILQSERQIFGKTRSTFSVEPAPRENK
jgi:hypothetical protein